MIRERQQEGAVIANAKELYRDKKPKLSAIQIEEAKKTVAELRSFAKSMHNK